MLRKQRLSLDACDSTQHTTFRVTELCVSAPFTDKCSFLLSPRIHGHESLLLSTRTTYTSLMGAIRNLLITRSLHSYTGHTPEDRSRANTVCVCVWECVCICGGGGRGGRKGEGRIERSAVRQRRRQCLWRRRSDSSPMWLNLWSITRRGELS